jgi:hypothetical protein
MREDDPLFPHHLFALTDSEAEAEDHALRYLFRHDPDDVIFFFRMWLEKNNKVEAYRALRYMKASNTDASLIESADFQRLFVESVVYQVEDGKWTLHKILLGREKYSTPNSLPPPADLPAALENNTKERVYHVPSALWDVAKASSAVKNMQDASYPPCVIAYVLHEWFRSKQTYKQIGALLHDAEGRSDPERGKGDSSCGRRGKKLVVEGRNRSITTD